MTRKTSFSTQPVLLVVLLAACGVALGACKDDPKADPSSSGGATAASAASSAGEVHLPGVDTSPLLPRERLEWSEEVRSLMSPCSDVAVPVAQCVLEKRDCPRCISAAKLVLKMVRGGLPREEIEKIYKERFDPAAQKSIPIDGSPTEGADDAKETLVEFADFECPYCAMEYPHIEKMLQDRKGKIRLVFKVKLLGHPHGEIAARAAYAAQQQGKFWEMHHKLFDNQRALEQKDLDSYAKALGLDVAKFDADMKGALVNDQLDRDKKLEDSLNIDHTPTLYLNGRSVEPGEDLDDVLNEELGELPPAPSGSASASAPVPSASAVPSSSANKPAPKGK
jgi:predicted DsbA family dithiol-disulfide isomerase